jgi:hydroxylamine reductase
MSTDKMFCFQCQEAIGNKGCTKIGACGKNDQVTNLQYVAIHVVKGIAYWNTLARKEKIGDKTLSQYNAKILFATITNANFDSNWFLTKINEGLELRNKMKEKFLETYSNAHGSKFSETNLDAATWTDEITEANIPQLVAKGITVNPFQTENEDIRSLVELIIIGLKGLSAYVDHALVLGYENDEIWAFLDEALSITLNTGLGLEELVALTLKTGEFGVKAMALLDEANTTSFGHPEPSNVNIGVGEKPGILISGHDLRDLKELLEQSEGQGIDIYTHGEMLPANAYPELKKFKHLKGNYGGSWWHQGKEFDSFNGPILLTTNCLIPPRKSYLDRIFVTGNVGWPNAKIVSERENNKPKDFSEIIEFANKCDPPTSLESGTIPIGFARNSVLSVADKVVEGIKSGAIKRFVVMAGCDGRHKTRNYFTEVASQLPKDTIILTAGCAKYRYNKLELGDIGGIPRILDAGQCNDSYSLVVIALKLAEVFEKESVNDLPLSFDIAWYEQKAVIVLLALLHLGVKKIRLGPTLPAFLSPAVVDVLVKNFEIMGIQTPEADIKAMMEGQ